MILLRTYVQLTQLLSIIGSADGDWDLLRRQPSEAFRETCTLSLSAVSA